MKATESRRNDIRCPDRLPPDSAGISEEHKAEWLPVVKAMPKFLEAQATEAYKRWKVDKAEQRGWANGYVRT